ncbi:MAG: hypothetical protein JWM69_1087, partial [Candidatus Binatus sp.]|nr:hypothetical protein [Candidatus Binatus sp.]
DTPELKRRIQMLHGFAKDAGRNPDEIEISGLLVLSMAKGQPDASMRETIAGLGFKDHETARRSPVLLAGTPAEVRREIASRVETTGMTYYIVFPTSAESQELFVKEVMPEFAK